jgi:hypothetical protein
MDGAVEVPSVSYRLTRSVSVDLQGTSIPTSDLKAILARCDGDTTTHVRFVSAGGDPRERDTVILDIR